MLLNKSIVIIIAVLSVYSLGLSLYHRPGEQNDDNTLLAKGSDRFEMSLMPVNRKREDQLSVNEKEIKQQIPEQQEEKEKGYESMDEMITAFETLYEYKYLTAMEKIDFTQNDPGQDTFPNK